MPVILVSRAAAALAVLALVQACSQEINGPGLPDKVRQPSMDPGVHPLPSVDSISRWIHADVIDSLSPSIR
jgi:hypothetical protein